MRNYPVKENPIGLAVSKILRYKQTNRQTDIVLLCIIEDDNSYMLHFVRTDPNYSKASLLK